MLILEGIASSGLQIIAIRQSMPFVGSSILSTSIIISFFLAALAAGYMYGGRVPSAKHHTVLVRNLTISIPLFGLGMSYTFHELFYVLLSRATTGMGLIGNPLIHVSLFCLLFMAPLVYLLAQTVPLLLNSSDKARHSEAAGDATAFSTIGNVVGCLLTSLVVMHYWGVAFSIMLSCAFLCVCLLVVADSTARARINSIVLSFLLLAAIYIPNITISKILFEYDNAYSNTQVVNGEGGRSLVINRSASSFISEDGTYGHEYTQIIRDGIINRAEGKDLLVLGAGGFTLTKPGDSFKSITYVDVDPGLAKVAEEKLLKRKIAGDFYADDARRFLLKGSRKWDYIVIDVYTNAMSVPTHISTSEFYSLVRRSLKKSGSVVINMLLSPALNDEYSQNMDHTIRSNFARCITDVADMSAPVTNVVYFCSSTAATRLTAYHDDSTRIDIERFLSVVTQ